MINRAIAALAVGATLTPAATAAPETNELLKFSGGVRATVNRAVREQPATTTHLVLYALPNRNTTTQSFGYRVPEDPKPDHNVQHIGAQSRWLRDRFPATDFVVVYLECEGLGWPRWRRLNDPSGHRIASIANKLHDRFKNAPGLTVTLTGHSGGGGFAFALLDANEQVPAWIDRIAFLDSNYGYKPEKNHGAKLARWLASNPTAQLTTLAYQDYLALDEGKSFVSKDGGTWGKSFAMLYDLSKSVEFRVKKTRGWQTHAALDGRVQVILKENPTREIFHSPQVERNGFIHALLTGTPHQSKRYTYFGRPVYSRYISPPPGTGR